MFKNLLEFFVKINIFPLKMKKATIYIFYVQQLIFYIHIGLIKNPKF